MHFAQLPTAAAHLDTRFTPVGWLLLKRTNAGAPARCSLHPPATSDGWPSLLRSLWHTSVPSRGQTSHCSGTIMGDGQRRSRVHCATSESRPMTRKGSGRSSSGPPGHPCVLYKSAHSGWEPSSAIGRTAVSPESSGLRIHCTVTASFDLSMR